MPSEQEIRAMLTDAQYQAYLDSYKIDEFGLTAGQRDTLASHRAAGFNTEVTAADGTKYFTIPEDMGRIGDWLAGPLFDVLPPYEEEDLLVQKFSGQFGVLGWISTALTNWGLRQAGLQAGLDGYLQRWRNWARKNSKYSTLDIQHLHSYLLSEGLNWDSAPLTGTWFSEQLDYLGYQEELQPAVIRGMWQWPDLGTVAGHYFNTWDYKKLSDDNQTVPILPFGKQADTWWEYYNRISYANSVPPVFLPLMLESNLRPMDPISAKMLYLRMRESEYLPSDAPTPETIPGVHQTDAIWSAWYDRNLYRNRMNPYDILDLRHLDWMIPPAQDLITMAVREVFSPEQAEALSLFEELPEDFVKWGKQQGLSQYWVKNYWGAHWQLPSPQMGFEMFQRSFMTETELKGLLKALDVAPVWRDPMMAIAYNVITRVDARRMHKLGVMDEAGLLKVYMDQGYNPDDAQRMVNFTIAFNLEEDRDLTKGELLRIFKDGLIGESELKQGLVDLHYSPHAIKMLILKVYYDLEIQEKELTKGEVKRLYMFATITESEVRERLAAMDLTAEGIDLLVKQWKLEKSLKQTGEGGEPKKLTRSEVTGFLSLGIIDAVTWQQEMDSIGYTAQQIDWFAIAFMLSQEGK